MISAAQNVVSVLSALWGGFCSFFRCLLSFLRGESWSNATITPLYHDVKTHDASVVLSPAAEGRDPSSVGDDLESGLSGGSRVESAISFATVSSGTTGSSATREFASPAAHSSILVLTSSVLSPFILEGRGITLSESAKALLSLEALSPTLPPSPGFTSGLGKEEVHPTTSLVLHRVGEGELDSIPPVTASPDWSPSLTTVATSRPAPSSPCFAPHQDMDTCRITGGTGDIVDRGEPMHKDGLQKATSKPRPPSAVRHSLKFSLSHQAFACFPGVMPGQQLVPPSESVFIPPSLSMSHSVATLLSLPETSDVFRGALVTDGDDVHLPSSLSAPEPRYYEFYYDYYCQEPVLPLDSVTENAIRKSLLLLSPVLITPPDRECNDPRDSGTSQSQTLRPQNGRMSLSSHASPDSWHTALPLRITSMRSSISTALLTFPTFPSTSAGSSTDSGADDGGDEAEVHQLVGQGITVRKAFSSPSPSYVDPETGFTPRQLLQELDRTLETARDHKDGGPSSDSSASSSEGSMVGSEDSLALSGEATLLHAKRGSLFKPIVLMRVPGTRESIAVNLDPPPYSERDLAEVDTGSGEGAVRLSQGSRLIGNHGQSRASIDSIEETFTLLSPPTRCSFILPPKDDEEEEYAVSDEESDVEWLSWPRGARPNGGRQGGQYVLTGFIAPRPHELLTCAA